MSEESKSALEQLLTEIHKGPSGRGGRPADAPKPLGVPEDYYVERTATRAVPKGMRGGLTPKSYTVPTVVTPRYFAGHELGPGSLPAEEIARLQRAMAAAGILKGSYRIGVWDDQSIGAYRSLLEFANVAGVDEREALRRYSEAPESDPDAGADRAPLVVRTPNPEDLRAIFKRAAASELGKADPEMLERMVSSYTGVVTDYQKQAYAAAPTGGTIQEPPSADVYAAEQARTKNPAQAEAYGMYGRAREFFDLLDEAG